MTMPSRRDLFRDPGGLGSLDALRENQASTNYKLQSYELVPANVARILDVGCGTGDDALALAERCGPGTFVIGLERELALVDEAMRRARNVALNVHFAVGDAHSLPFLDDSFDIVRADRLLYEVEQRSRVVKELVRVMRPGGRLLLHDHESLLTDGGALLPGLVSLDLCGTWSWQAGNARECGVSLLGIKGAPRAVRASHHVEA